MKLRQVRTQPDVESLKQEFDQWRSTRIRGESIPESLWEKTIDLAKKYPHSQIARLMSLDASSLKNVWAYLRLPRPRMWKPLG